MTLIPQIRFDRSNPAAVPSLGTIALMFLAGNLRSFRNRQCDCQTAIQCDANTIMAQYTIRAIVVDDEVHVRNLVKISLSLHGIECDCAADCSEALALLEAGQYNLAIIDLKMPKQHGHS